MKEKNKKLILNFLKKQKEKINLLEISNGTNLSYPTVLKYCDILKLEKKITIKEYGNMRLTEIV